MCDKKVVHVMCTTMQVKAHTYCMAWKFYSLLLNHLDKSLQILILQKPSFVLDVMVMHSRFLSSLRILILRFYY